MNKKIANIDLSKIVESGDVPSFYQGITIDIIKHMEHNNSASFQEITKYVGGSDRRVIRLLDQLVKLGILRFSNTKFFLRNPVQKYNFRISDVRCNQCDSKMVNIDGKIKPIVNFMKEVLKSRPKPTFVFDQRPVNAETVVRRIAYTILRGDIQGKKIAIVGDDDLTSVALAQTSMAREIIVFDIDERVLAYIKNVSKKYSLDIKIIKQDLLKNIPSSFLNYFDVFITDPTPTPKPLGLFTSRGLEMLSKSQGKVGYISLYPSHMERTIEFQRMLAKMNVLITDLIPFFNQYDFLEYTYTSQDLELLKKYASSESKISFCEHLMRIETTSLSKPMSLKLSPLDLMGRATKRILDDSSKDPVLSEKEKPAFIQEAMSQLKDLLNKNERG